VRGIYPNVAVIDANGFLALTDDDVAARAQNLLGSPARGGNETQGPPADDGNGSPA
jgi:hypothetical protein